MQTEVLSVRVPRGTTDKLKLLACKLSLEQNRPFGWSFLVKAAIDNVLLTHERGVTAEQAQGGADA